MKLLDNMPIFFRVTIDDLEVKSTRARGSADNNYITITGIGTELLKPGLHWM